MLPIVEVGLSMTAVCVCGSIVNIGNTFFCSFVPRGGELVMVVPLCTCSIFEDEDAAFCFVHS
jgi:hypothetical protein